MPFPIPTRPVFAGLLAMLALSAAGHAAAGERRACPIVDMACRAFTGQLPPGMTADAAEPARGGPRLPRRFGAVVLSFDAWSLERARRCLTLAVYGEARGEVAVGMEAVIWVIANRVASPAFPDAPCAVIAQPAQFEFMTEPRFRPQAEAVRAGRMPPRLTPGDRAERSALTISRALAYQAFDGGLVHDKTLGATHFLAPEIMRRRGGLPGWTRALTRTVEIGGHRFYRFPED